jgi:hypothetical protein
MMSQRGKRVAVGGVCVVGGVRVVETSYYELLADENDLVLLSADPRSYAAHRSEAKAIGTVASTGKWSTAKGEGCLGATWRGDSGWRTPGTGPI